MRGKRNATEPIKGHKHRASVKIQLNDDGD